MRLHMELGHFWQLPGWSFWSCFRQSRALRGTSSALPFLVPRLYCFTPFQRLYHGFTKMRLKTLFRKFDHMAIFLLIAGTYTPFCLTVLNGWIGWTLFGVVWACAAAGIILKVFSTGRYEVLSTALYVAMGWIVVLFIKPVFSATSIEGFIFLMTGGAFYSIGVFFFVRDKVRYFHGIWHMFVLAGSTFISFQF